MAHVQKFTKDATGHMFAHYDRSAGEKIGNENVDLKKSHLNYNLAVHQPKQQLDFLNSRLSEVKVQNRKDVNVMCSWVITVPQDLPYSNHAQFFKGSFVFLKNLYGENNIISAYVHLDETTPHMHFAFIPITVDSRKGGYKVSAKEVLTKNDLKCFHQNLSAHLHKVFGHDIGILNGATANGNKSVNVLKKESAVAEDQLNLLTNKLESLKSSMKEEIVLARVELNSLTKERESLKCSINEEIALNKVELDSLTKQRESLKCSINEEIVLAKVELDSLTKERESLKHSINEETKTLHDIKSIQPQKTFTSAIKGVTIEDINALKKTALDSSQWRAKALTLSKDCKTLTDKNNTLNEDLLKRPTTYQLSTLQYKLKKSEEKSENTFLKINKALEHLPNEVATQFVQAWEQLDSRPKKTFEMEL